MIIYPIKKPKKRSVNVKWEINNSEKNATKYLFFPSLINFSTPYRTNGTKNNNSMVTNSVKLLKYHPLNKYKMHAIIIV
ncbi:hypothetical protein T23_01080 [Turicibacter faecis]|uniref:Uncharacterized protein n=1 Tax=Turicibacter faecis TaxID=2963365 RepID=A0ABM8IG96_9FIRM|nr:hypothetical protein T23_01080 [Turicibacter sp. TC023]